MLKEHVQLLIVTGMMYMHYAIITTSPSSSYVKNKFSKRSIKARVPLYQFSYGMPCLGFSSYNPLYLDCIIFRRTRRVVPLTYQATFLSEKQEYLNIISFRYPHNVISIIYEVILSPLSKGFFSRPL